MRRSGGAAPRRGRRRPGRRRPGRAPGSCSPGEACGRRQARLARGAGVRAAPAFARPAAPPHRRTPGAAGAAACGRRWPCRSCRRTSAPPAPRPAVPRPRSLPATSAMCVSSVMADDIRWARSPTPVSVTACAAVALRGRARAPRGASTSRRARRRGPGRNWPSDHLPVSQLRRCARRASRSTLAPAPRSVCWPSSGGGRSVRTGVALSFIGLATSSQPRRQRMLPAGAPCRASCTCGSANTSARLLIAPHGTLAASSAASHSALAARLHDRLRAAAPARRGCARGPGCCAKRGSAASSGRPATSQNLANWPSLPTARIMWSLAAVGRRRDLEHLVGHDVLVRIAGAPGHLAADQVVGAQVGQHRHLRVEQRHVDVLAFAGALGVAQRGQDGHGGVHAGEQVGHRHAHLLRAAAEVVALAGDAHQPAHALDRVVVAGAVAVGPGLAEAGDAAVDEPRVERLAARRSPGRSAPCRRP